MKQKIRWKGHRDTLGKIMDGNMVNLKGLQDSDAEVITQMAINKSLW